MTKDARITAILSTLEEDDPEGDLNFVVREGICDYGFELAEDLSSGPTPWERDRLTEIAIRLSVCPIHFCDWASCFDDDDEECEQVRTIFPYSHDT